MPKTCRRISYDFPFVAGRDYPAGATALCFGLGYGRQEIEIGGVEFRMTAGTELKDLPRTPVVYSGSEPDAGWRSAAAARIEKHRKGNLTVTVLDGQGRPVPDAEVEVEMTRHAFQFSSAEAYLKGRATPASPTPVPQTTDPTGGVVPPVPPPTTTQPPLVTTSASGLAWTGEIPPQKWMNFYTKSSPSVPPRVA
jgi:hypothetical protein